MGYRGELWKEHEDRKNARIASAAPAMHEALWMVARQYRAMVDARVGQWGAMKITLAEYIEPILREIDGHDG